MEESVFNKTSPANIRLDENVLRTSWRHLSSSSSEDVFKMSWSKRIYSPYSHVFRRRLQDVFRTSWSRPIYSSWSYVLKTSCQYVFKTSSRRLQDVLQKRLQDIFKMSSRRFEDVFKTSSKDIFKTFSRRIIKLNFLVNTSLRSIQQVSETLFSKRDYLQWNMPR